MGAGLDSTAMAGCAARRLSRLRNWAAAGGRADDPLGHLPRSFGAADAVLAEAAFLAASADEPIEMNFVRKHALEHQREQGCDLETAALRVFSNADGAYGANVNQLIDAGCWTDEDELAEAYQARKCFAYGRRGKPGAPVGDAPEHPEARRSRLPERGIRGARRDHDRPLRRHPGRHKPRRAPRAAASSAPVYIGDQTHGEAKVRTLAEQVALETRTRMLNPRWYEGCLSTATKACARSRPR